MSTRIFENFQIPIPDIAELADSCKTRKEKRKIGAKIINYIIYSTLRDFLGSKVKSSEAHSSNAYVIF